MSQDDKKKTPIKLRTPSGRLGWPKLTEPDFGSKDYPKPDGEYSTKLILKSDDPVTQQFIKSLQPHYEAAIADAKVEFAKLKPETRKKLKDVTENPLFTELLDKETEEPTGEIEFKFSKKASFVAQKGPRAGERVNVKVALFDAKGGVIQKAPQIWGGSVAKVAFVASPYFISGTGIAGLKLNLDAVQIIELRQGGGKSAGDYGFGEEEGYSHSDAAAESSDTNEADDGKAETPDF
jgi:hypothetical protein